MDTQKDDSPKMMTANEAYKAYSVTRAWLRNAAAERRIRRSTVHGRDSLGRSYVKYLYAVADIEGALMEVQDAGNE